jgi:hypothetical protein
VTAVAVFRNPNTIPFCLTTDLLLNILFSWLLVHLPSTFFFDILFFFFPLVSTYNLNFSEFKLMYRILKTISLPSTISKLKNKNRQSHSSACILCACACVRACACVCACACEIWSFTLHKRLGAGEINLDLRG